LCPGPGEEHTYQLLASWFLDERTDAEGSHAKIIKKHYKIKTYSVGQLQTRVPFQYKKIVH